MLHIAVSVKTPATPPTKLETIVIWQERIEDVLIAVVIYILNVKDFKLPVFVHNLKGYDSHLIICNAHEFQSKQNIDVIAQNSETCMLFGFDNLQFKYIVSLLSSSLHIYIYIYISWIK